MVGAAVENGRAEIVPDVSREPRYLACNPETRSEIVVPIATSRGTVGAVDIASNQPGAFGERDLQFLGSLAADLGRKIEAHRREALEEVEELEEEEGDES
jgi:putative methionine-R-sulfoxide reductase with GAF domain